MATQIYYSFGQNTDTHLTGTPTISIASGVATLTVSQTATNLIVGDKITHAGGDGSCYIKSFQSQTVFNVMNATGGNPTNVTAQSVTSITHVWASLALAEAGVVSVLGTEDLVTNDYNLHLSACCDDSGTDTTRVIFGSRASTGWQTDNTRRIRIYTPKDVGTNCNQSQRHDGKWKSTAWNMVLTPDGNYQRCIVTDGYYADLNPTFITIEGLQLDLHNSGAKTSVGVLRETNGTGNGWIVDHNVITVSDGPGDGIFNTTSSGVWLITNNVIYGNGHVASNTYGIWRYGDDGGIYNNVLTKFKYGLRLTGSDGPVKNNAVFNNNQDWYSITSSSDHDYNASDNDPTGETNWVDLDENAGGEWTASFTDYANDDYSPKGAGSLLVDEGTSTSPDVTDDIIGTSRPQGSAYDIGAFEYELQQSGPRNYPRGVAQGIARGVA